MSEPVDDLALYVATLELQKEKFLAGYDLARRLAAVFLALWLVTLFALGWCLL